MLTTRFWPSVSQLLEIPRKTILCLLAGRVATSNLIFNSFNVLHICLQVVSCLLCLALLVVTLSLPGIIYFVCYCCICLGKLTVKGICSYGSNKSFFQLAYLNVTEAFHLLLIVLISNVFQFVTVCACVCHNGTICSCSHLL